jgi:formiminotetrahydrofolate cyclodeaminase
MATGLVGMAARASAEGWAEAAGAVAQAESIRRRVTPLAAEDAQVYEEALSAMRSPAGTTGEERDAAIHEALTRAAEIPFRIAEAGADAAALAATVAERGDQAVRGDAAAAAVLSAAAARAAANLVAINLASGADDRLIQRARRRADEAADSVRGTLDLSY